MVWGKCIKISNVIKLTVVAMGGFTVGCSFLWIKVQSDFNLSCAANKSSHIDPNLSKQDRAFFIPVFESHWSVTYVGIRVNDHARNSAITFLR